MDETSATARGMRRKSVRCEGYTRRPRHCSGHLPGSCFSGSRQGCKKPYTLAVLGAPPGASKSRQALQWRGLGNSVEMGRLVADLDEFSRFPTLPSLGAWPPRLPRSRRWGPPHFGLPARSGCSRAPLGAGDPGNCLNGPGPTRSMPRARNQTVGIASLVAPWSLPCSLLKVGAAHRFLSCSASTDSSPLTRFPWGSISIRMPNDGNP
jgi:hypothetical protein